MDTQIMKLAEALYTVSPDTQPWDGDPFGFHESIQRGGYHAKLAIRQAQTLVALDIVKDFNPEAIPSQWELIRSGKIPQKTL